LVASEIALEPFLDGYLGRMVCLGIKAACRNVDPKGALALLYLYRIRLLRGTAKEE